MPDRVELLGLPQWLLSNHSPSSRSGSGALHQYVESREQREGPEGVASWGGPNAATTTEDGRLLSGLP